MDSNTEAQLIGVILVTHTDYGARLIKAAEFILGGGDQCHFVSIDGTHEVERTVARLKETVAKADQGKGVLILTDMFGGTPTNISLSLLGSGALEVVTGVNLPMLLKVLNNRGLALDDLAVEAKNAGCSGIVVAGEILRSRVKE